MEVLVVADLEKFTGQAPGYYGTFVDEALEQASDLYALATCTDALPDETTRDGRIARRGMLEMAEALYEGQEYRSLRHVPFKSENIGSYSYTLVSEKIIKGLPTGLGWFDLAVAELGKCERVMSSSVSVFPRDGDFRTQDGVTILVGPADRPGGTGDEFKGSP